MTIDASSARKHVPGGPDGKNAKKSSVDVPGAIGVYETVNNCQSVVSVLSTRREPISEPPLISLKTNLNNAPADSPRAQMLAVYVPAAEVVTQFG